MTCCFILATLSCLYLNWSSLFSEDFYQAPLTMSKAVHAIISLIYTRIFGDVSGKKKPACQCRRYKRFRFNSWVRKIPWRRKWHPTPASPVGFPSGSEGKEFACNAGDTRDTDSIPGSGRSLEEEMATHSSILAWKIPWTEEPGRLQSMASQRVGHD